MTKREVEEYIMSQIYPNASHEVKAQNVRNAFAPIVERVWTYLEGKIGSLDNLTTAHRETIVHAINSVVMEIGDLSKIESSDKRSFVDAVNAIVAKFERDLGKTEGKIDMTFHIGNNHFDHSVAMGGYALSSSGDIIERKRSAVTGYVEIPDGATEIYVRRLPIWSTAEGDGNKRFAYYDADKKIIGGVSSFPCSTASFTIGARNAKYIVVEIYRDMTVDAYPSDLANAIKETAINTQYYPVGYSDYEKLITAINGFNFASVKNLCYLGKKWACVGDSYTERGERCTKAYYDYVREDTGIDIVNMGDGGTGWKAGDNLNRAFYQRITNTPDDVDVVTLFGSFNDITGSSTLGNVTDTSTSTICGCVNAALDWLMINRPLVPVGVISPTPWMELTPFTSSAVAYFDALKGICERRSIPFLDLFHHSGLQPWIPSVRDALYTGEYMRDDGHRNGTHPDHNGHRLFAPRIREFVKSLL